LNNFSKDKVTARALRNESKRIFIRHKDEFFRTNLQAIKGCEPFPIHRAEALQSARDNRPLAE